MPARSNASTIKTARNFIRPRTCGWLGLEIIPAGSFPDVSKIFRRSAVPSFSCSEPEVEAAVTLPRPGVDRVVARGELARARCLASLFEAALRRYPMKPGYQS